MFGWYIDNLPTCKVKLRSHLDVRRKFLPIQDKMELGPSTHEGKVGDQAKRLATELKGWCWPKGSEEQLPVVCQISFDNLLEFRDNIQQVGAKARQAWDKMINKSAKDGSLVSNGCKEKKMLDYIRTLLNCRLSNPTSFLRDWFEDYFDRIEHWSGWNGIIKPLRVDSKEFEDEMKTIGTNLCGDWKCWELLKEELYGH